jgi:hypothetical protein
MVEPIQTLLTVGIPTLAVLMGILVNNSRLTDLRGYMDSRFNSMDSRFNSMDQLFSERLRRVEEVMDARLSRIEQELHLK